MATTDKPTATSGFTDTVRDILTVKRVFGDAYEREGKTVIPVAKVWGGLGLGEATGGMGGKGRARFRRGGEDDEPLEPSMTGQGEAGGGAGGLGVMARPAGVYVIDGDEVFWQPAVSVNQLAWVIGAVAAVGLASLPCLVRAFRKRR